MSDSTVETLVTDDETQAQVVNTEKVVSVIFDPKTILAGKEILNLQNSDIDDITRLRILEGSTADDLIATEALVDKFVSAYGTTDEMAAVKAIAEKAKGKKNFLEMVQARQKAELENFDKMKDSLIENYTVLVQDAIKKVLSKSNLGSEVCDQLMVDIGQELTTVELDME